MEQRGELYTLTINQATMAEDGIVEFELPIEDGLPIKSKAKLEIIKPKPSIDSGLPASLDVEEREEAEFVFFCENDIVSCMIKEIRSTHTDTCIALLRRYVIVLLLY